jgi:hypothetical protein
VNATGAVNTSLDERELITDCDASCAYFEKLMGRTPSSSLTFARAKQRSRAIPRSCGCV